MEALQRYEQGRLPQHLRCWVRGVLELGDGEGCTSSELLPPVTQAGHSSR